MNVLIYDIETMQELFLINIYNPQEDTSKEFMVSRWHYSLDAFMNYVDNHKDYHWVGYNNLRFDSQGGRMDHS